MCRKIVLDVFGNVFDITRERINIMGDPIYKAPAPLLDEQYAELAEAMGLDPETIPDEKEKNEMTESEPILWRDPPPPKPRRDLLVAAQLRLQPGRWALIHQVEAGLGFMPWWGPLNESPDFEIQIVWKKPGTLFGPRDIYARFVGSPEQGKHD